MLPIGTGAKTRVSVAPLLLMALVAAGALRTAEAQQVSMSGWFHVVWHDTRQGRALDEESIYVLDDGTGRWTRLLASATQMRPLGGPLALNRKRVIVTGQLVAAGIRQRPQLGQPRTLEVHSIQYEGEPAPLAALGIEPVTGPQPWVNILCKFADVTTEPRSAAWIQGEFGSTAPGLDHYWRAASEDRINIGGTATVGWYDLPQPRSYYVYDRDGDGDTDGPWDVDFQRATVDCTGVADADVYFPDFVGINLMFNDLLDCCAYGGSRTLNLDGVTRVYRVTWEPPWGYQNQGVLAHEMGHGFGLPHSSGPYDETYDSRWDVMSSVWGNCPPHDPTYGCVGVHTISYHKDLLEWVPSERKYVPSPGTVQTITLERLGEPTTTTGYLMAELPLTDAPDVFYTVEARRLAGYDATLPGKAVVLHRVDPYDSRPARVVDPDGDGDPNDEAAIWLPGETFRDDANQIVVTVDDETGTGFVVTIHYQAAQILLRVGDETTDAILPDGRIDIPVSVDMSNAEGTDLASIQFDLQWEPARLSYISYASGTFGSVTVNETQSDAGLLTVGVFNATGTTSSFTAVQVTLDAGATEGFTEVSASATAAGDELGNDVLPIVFEEDLMLCIGIDGYLGDVTADDAINIIDAQQIARFSAALPVANPDRMLSHGDVSEDGNINIVDAQQTARYSIELETPGAPNIGAPVPGGCASQAPPPMLQATVHAR